MSFNGRGFGGKKDPFDLKNVSDIDHQSSETDDYAASLRGGRTYSGRGHNDRFSTGSVINSSLGGDSLQKELIRVNEQLQRDLAKKQEKIIELSSQNTLKADYQKLAEEYQKVKFFLDSYRSKEDRELDLQDEIAERDAQVEQLKHQLEAQAKEYESVIAESREEKAGLLDDVELLEEKLAELDGEGSSLEAQLGNLRRENKSSKKEIAQLNELIKQLKDGSRVDDLDQELLEYRRRLQQAEADNDELILQLKDETQKSFFHKEEKELLRTEMVVKHEDDLALAHAALEQKIEEVDKLKAENKSLTTRFTLLEKTKAETDDHLLQARGWMAEYERGYGLTDAVGEIRTLKAKIRQKDEELMKNQNDLNKRERQLQKWVAENRTLREKFNISDEWHLDEDELDLYYNVENQKSKALIRHQEDLIEKLERDRTEMLGQLRKGAMHTAAAGLVFLDCTEEQTKKVAEYAERLAKGDNSIPLDDQSQELAAKVKVLNAELDEAKHNYYHLQVETDEIKEKYMALQEERKTSEFAEILAHMQDLKVHATVGGLQGGPAMNTTGNNITLNTSLNVQNVVETINKMEPADKAQLAQVLFPAAATTQPPNLSFSSQPSGIPQDFSQYVKQNPVPESRVDAALEQELEQLRHESVSHEKNLSQAKKIHEESELELKKSRVELELLHHKLDLAEEKDAKLQELHRAASLHNQTKQSEFDSARVELQRKQALHAAHQGKINNLTRAASKSMQSFKDQLTFSVVPEAIRTLGSHDQQAVFLGCFEELVAKDELLSKANDQLELYKLRFHKLAAQQQILYEQFSAAQVEWAKNKVELTTKVQTLETDKDVVATELDLSEKARALQSKDLAELRGETEPAEEEQEGSRVSQLERELLTLTVNHKILARQFNSQKNELETVMSREESVSRELLQMESVLRTRIVELEEMKTAAEGRASSLEALTRTWVPREELIRLAHQHQVLKSKYAEMIAQAGRDIVTRDGLRSVQLEKTKLEGLYQSAQEEIKVMQQSETTMKKAMEKLGKIAAGKGKARIESAPALLAQLTSLRVKYDLTEQRAQRSHEQKVTAEAIANQVQEEMGDMERKLEEAHHKYVAEHELLETMRSELEGTISYSKAVQMHKEQDSLRQECAKLRAEVNKYRSHAELAVAQAKDALQSMNNPESAIAIEVRDGLKRALMDSEKLSDDQAIIGKLNRELIVAKKEKREAEQKTKKHENNLAKVESALAKLQHHLESRNADIFRVKSHYRQNLAERDKEIVSLQVHVSQALTLKQAETLTQANASLSARLDNERQNNLALREQVEKANFAEYIQY